MRYKTSHRNNKTNYRRYFSEDGLVCVQKIGNKKINVINQEMTNYMTHTCCTSLTSALVKTDITASARPGWSYWAYNTSTLVLATERSRIRHEENTSAASGAASHRRWIWRLLSGQAVFHQLTQSHQPCWGIHCKQKNHSHHGFRVRSRDWGCSSQQRLVSPIKAPQRLIMNWCAQRRHTHLHCLYHICQMIATNVSWNRHNDQEHTAVSFSSCRGEMPSHCDNSVTSPACAQPGVIRDSHVKKKASTCHLPHVLLDVSPWATFLQVKEKYIVSAVPHMWKSNGGWAAFWYHAASASTQIKVSKCLVTQVFSDASGCRKYFYRLIREKF